MLAIGTNASALMAQAATASVQIGAETAMQRLSSGKRINAAKDDAAGVAITSRMTSHVKGLHQSIRNSMDAQALISTAEGGLQETEVLLQRIRELAVQASNDTNSDADRTNLNNEAQQLLEGIDAVASGTTWAGQNLLDGTYSNKSFQVGGGSMAADQLTTSLQSSTAIELGLGFIAATAEVSQVGGETQAVTIADGTETTVVGDLIRLQADDTGGFVINGIDRLDRAGYRVSNAGDVNGDGLDDLIIGAYNADPNGNSIAGESYVVFGKTDGTAVELSDVTAGTGGFVINGIDASDFSGYSVSNAGDVNGDGLDDVIVGAYGADPNGKIYAGESYVVFGKTDTDAVELSEVSQNPPALSSNATIVIHGKTIAIDLSSYYDGSTNDYYGAAAAVAAVINNDTDLQALDYSAIAATSTQVAAGTHLAGDVIVSRADTPITTVATNEVPEVPAISLTNHSNAQNALTRLDTALQTINSQRAELGSLSNRLDHVIANNTNASTNAKASLGRIQDADFAAETTKLAKSKILEQSSTAMLAQANASVYEVLTLIPD